MTPEEFVKGFYKEKETSIDLYFNSNSETEVGELIKSMSLNESDREKLQKIIDGVLTDGFYNILLGIDGAAAIGDNQELYQLLDEDGKEITGGEIESYAWEYFQNDKYETDNID